MWIEWSFEKRGEMKAISFRVQPVLMPDADPYVEAWQVVRARNQKIFTMSAGES